MITRAPSPQAPAPGATHSRARAWKDPLLMCRGTPHLSLRRPGLRGKRARCVRSHSPSRRRWAGDRFGDHTMAPIQAGRRGSERSPSSGIAREPRDWRRAGRLSRWARHPLSRQRATLAGPPSVLLRPFRRSHLMTSGFASRDCRFDQMGELTVEQGRVEARPKRAPAVSGRRRRLTFLDG